MEKVKTSSPPRVFLIYFQPTNHVYETRFPKIMLNFQKVTEAQNYEIIPMTERIIVSDILLKVRVKEKLLSNENIEITTKFYIFFFSSIFTNFNFTFKLVV